MMGKVDQFLNELVYFDKENIHPDVIKVYVLFDMQFKNAIGLKVNIDRHLNLQIF